MFFIAAKIFWMLVQPASLLLLLIAAGLIAVLRGRHRRGSLLVGTGLVLFLLIGLLPVGALAIRPLETAYPANPPLAQVQGIVVLGGGEQAGRSRYWQMPLVNEAGDRFLAALALAHRFPQARVLFTGGRGSLNQRGPSGASVAREIFLADGVAPDRLLLEGKSRNTIENARLSRDLLGGAPAGHWVLVTSAAHMPRAMAAFCAAGWRGLIPWPTDYRSGPVWPGLDWRLSGHLETLDFALHEWIGLLAYRLTGRGARCDG